MGINKDFECLSVGLPDDIARYKAWGDFDKAVALIDERMQQDIPDGLKRCMRVQREMMLRLDEDYPFTREQALAKVRANIPDFTEEEFDRLTDEDKMGGWIYIGGEKRYFIRFYQTLIKTNADYQARVIKKDEEDTSDQGDSVGTLDTVMHYAKEHGKIGYNLRIRATVRIKDECFVPGKLVKVWLPIPAAARQIRNIVIHEITPEPKMIAPVDALQRTVYFEEVMTENHEFAVEYSYDNIIEYVDPKDENVTPDQPHFCTQEIQPHLVFTPYIKEIVATLTEGVTNPLAKARIFYDFVTKNVKYSFMRAYFGLENIAENCARNFRGDCGVQALLFITLCRCAGIPAKWQSGLYAKPGDVGMHDWAEFYVAPYGWMFADPSFGGGSFRIGNEERRCFYFGNLDPFRMVANREFQAEFVPESNYYRADPYDNQAGEMEYEDHGLRNDEYERDQIMTAYKQIF